MTTHPVDLKVGQRIRSLRHRLEITQDQLAQHTGVRFQQIQKYETGANRVSASRLSEIADFLGVSVGYFFDSKPPHVLESMTKETLEFFKTFQSLPEDKRDLVSKLVKDMSNGS